MRASVADRVGGQFLPGPPGADPVRGQEGCGAALVRRQSERDRRLVLADFRRLLLHAQVPGSALGRGPGICGSTGAIGKELVARPRQGTFSAWRQPETST